MRRELPMLITLITGLIILSGFFFGFIDWIRELTDKLQNAAIVIFGFAIILGIANLVVIHLRKLLEPSTNMVDRGASLILLLGLAVAIGLGLIYGKNPKIIAFKEPVLEIMGGFVPYVQLMTHTVEIELNPFVKFIFYHTYTPLQATMFSMLAFFIASASYRAFKVRNFEALLLLLSAVLVMLGRVPLGVFLWHKIFPFLPSVDDIANWIMIVPNTAGQRAILIGAGFGAVAISLKILLGIERSYMGKGE